jgi:hypothetical protein
VSTRFLSQWAAGHLGVPPGDAQAGPNDLERQQALLLRALDRAGGDAVGYDDLRAVGIEFPAAVVSELLLAGVPIERCRRTGPDGRTTLGVRLLADVASRDRPAPRPAAPAVTAAVRRARPRLVAPLALLAVLALATAIVALTVPSGGVDSRRRPTVSQRTRPSAVASTSRAPVGATTHRPAAPPPTPVSPVLAGELESRGHTLLTDGQYADAVSVLQNAVHATGESLNTCRVPDSSTCLTYAYALYDLGRALRLSGNPSAAVPILEHRLEIDNQRSTVEDELQLARHATG